MRAAVIVPAFEAQSQLETVLAPLCAIWPHREGVLVVNDGSTDDTTKVAESHGARVMQHKKNLGKGAALRTGLREAARLGFDVAVTLDADGQHPATEALRLHRSCDDAAALVLGVRDMVAAGAPRASQLSNRFSNVVLSGFTGVWLSDTQCGLRRYPIAATLALGGRALGYGYEAEIVILACASKMRVVEHPINVVYPPENERLSHFHPLRDPARIVSRVVRTVAITRARQLWQHTRQTRVPWR
ncbi:MAG TPA: glycosyltransferase family 2 protein [Sorangium sp.]|nr:glycosyltransferase family 2 protein [Sorangium sp.]